MARTLEAIETALVAEKTSRAELDVLSSPSETAIWRLWLKLCAYAAWVHETVWDIFKAEVEATAARAAPGTPGWLVVQAKLFQLDDDLTVIETATGYEVGYAPGTTGLKVVTQAATKEASDGRLFLKVASNGEALSAPHMVQFSEYIDRIKPAGIRVLPVSLEADRLQVFGTVYYNALLDLTTIKASVTASITAYLAALPFDGLVHRAKIEDAIQASTGVVDLSIGNIFLRSGAVLTALDVRLETASGRAIEEDAPLADTSSGLFADTLTFTPY
jgi:hypothetical protein